MKYGYLWLNLDVSMYLHSINIIYALNKDIEVYIFFKDIEAYIFFKDIEVYIFFKDI